LAGPVQDFVLGNLSAAALLLSTEFDGVAEATSLIVRERCAILSDFFRGAAVKPARILFFIG